MFGDAPGRNHAEVFIFGSAFAWISKNITHIAKSNATCDTLRWTLLSVEYTVLDGDSSVWVRIDNNFGGDVLLFDAFELKIRPGTSSYLPSPEPIAAQCCEAGSATTCRRRTNDTTGHVYHVRSLVANEGGGVGSTCTDCTEQRCMEICDATPNCKSFSRCQNSCLFKETRQTQA